MIDIEKEREEFEKAYLDKNRDKTYSWLVKDDEFKNYWYKDVREAFAMWLAAKESAYGEINRLQGVEEELDKEMLKVNLLIEEIRCLETECLVLRQIKDIADQCCVAFEEENTTLRNIIKQLENE